MTKTKKEVKKEAPKFKLNQMLFSKTVEEKTIILRKIKERGVSAPTLNRIRTAKSSTKKNFRLSTLQIIADVMNVRIDDLINI